MRLCKRLCSNVELITVRSNDVGRKLKCIQNKSLDCRQKQLRRDRWIYCVNSGLATAQSLLPNSLSKEELMPAETNDLNARGLHVLAPAHVTVDFFGSKNKNPVHLGAVDGGHCGCEGVAA